MSVERPLTSKTKIFCVIGYPIEHSMSPIMWNPALKELGLDFIYVAFNIRPEDLEKAINGMRAIGIKGMNVTVPHKQNVMKYIDEIDPIAQKIGAVNTIKNDGGILKAKNTDAEGAKKSLLEKGCKVEGKNVLILGSGGVARSITYILAEDANKIIVTDLVEDKALLIAREIKELMGISIVGKVSSEKNLKEAIKNSDILINATPIGMSPNIETTPISMDLLHQDLFVFDVVYNPLTTRLLREAAEVGCKTLGGLDMLINQGMLAFEWWTNKKPNKDLMKNKIIEYLGLV
ncbi:MAG: shikimate dehydrogenase [Promethearchaeota archaeon]